MTVLLRYLPYYGTPNIREVTAADFSANGVTDQNKVVWNPDNDHTAEVSDDAAALLQRVLPKEFKVVDSSSDATQSESGVASLGGTDDEGTSGTGPSTGSRRRRASNE